MRRIAFRVLPSSCDSGFLRKLPATCAALRFTLEASTTLRTLSLFSLPAFRRTPGTCAPFVPLGLSSLKELLLMVFLSGSRSGCLAVSFPKFSVQSPFGSCVEESALSREINQSFNQKTPGVLSCSFELTLARNDFLRKPSGTYEPSNLRLLAATLKRTLSTFLVVRITLDCSLFS